MYCTCSFLLINVGGVIGVLMKQLELKRQGHFLTSRVLQGIFNYLGEA